MLRAYGDGEKDSLCRTADPTLITRYARPGSHHFDRDYRALGEIIAGEIVAGALAGALAPATAH